MASFRYEAVLGASKLTMRPARVVCRVLQCGGVQATQATCCTPPGWQATRVAWVACGRWLPLYQKWEAIINLRQKIQGGR